MRLAVSRCAPRLIVIVLVVVLVRIKKGSVHWTDPWTDPFFALTGRTSNWRADAHIPDANAIKYLTCPLLGRSKGLSGLFWPDSYAQFGPRRSIQFNAYSVGRT